MTTPPSIPPEREKIWMKSTPELQERINARADGDGLAKEVWIFRALEYAVEHLTFSIDVKRGRRNNQPCEPGSN